MAEQSATLLPVVAVFQRAATRTLPGKVKKLVDVDFRRDAEAGQEGLLERFALPERPQGAVERFAAASIEHRHR